MNPLPQTEVKAGVEDNKGKSTTNIEQIKERSNATTFGEKLESSSKAETNEGGGKPPYCYKCWTKGHPMY